MATNRLIDEKSPYLLQHAHNPVDWYPWGPEAFAKAERENKPIFLSIGYSTCHWCHVMERESFENEQIAEILNRHFVSIKVDREERPDVDRIYMMFVQATTGSGGWPMSVWLTPDLRPFYGGTYFPPDNRYGRPGFAYLLDQLASAWERDRDRIREASRDIVERLRGYSELAGAGQVTEGALESASNAFRRSFDPRLGGFGGAPKFPRISTHNFLLRYHHVAKNQEALDMVLLTLREMAKGGMNDQLGGGFHRYSVDERWFVPHFEKMLYDQAQIAASYLEAHQITGDRHYADVAEAIFEYVLRDMTHPEGGFYSAEDADSVIDPAKPEEKGEGAFYIWAHDEIVSLLGQPAADWLCYRYGVEEDGNVRQDPHAEFTGKNILYQAHTIEETARRFEVTPEEVAQALEAARNTLVEARSRRIRPHLDDKVLTSWNALMISAFAKGAQVLGESRYYDAAVRAAEFILNRMYDPAAAGVLLRRFRDGEAAIPGFLDDYAFFTQALIDLYETTFDLRYLKTAIELTDTLRDLFEDREAGGFYSTGHEDSNLVLRVKDDYDGAEPSGNSIATLNLLRLSQITGNAAYRESAERAIRALAPRMNDSPVAVPQMLVAYMFSTVKIKQIILVGDRETEEMHRMFAVLRRRFLPQSIVLLAGTDEERRMLAGWLPVIETMTQIGGRATAYVCEDYGCKLPVGLDGLDELLQ
ncbi:MAG: thioredoxin domain-containing protein [Bryobacteraceae bacterium]